MELYERGVRDSILDCSPLCLLIFNTNSALVHEALRKCAVNPNTTRAVAQAEFALAPAVKTARGLATQYMNSTDDVYARANARLDTISAILEEFYGLASRVAAAEPRRAFFEQLMLASAHAFLASSPTRCSSPAATTTASSSAATTINSITPPSSPSTSFRTRSTGRCA